jgi:hypothetical protein
MKSTPTAEIIDEITRPQSTFNPPRVETFAMSAALLLNPPVPSSAKLAAIRLYIVYGEKDRKRGQHSIETEK